MKSGAALGLAFRLIASGDRHGEPLIYRHRAKLRRLSTKWDKRDK